MIDVLLILLCAYLALSNVQSLRQVPFSEWGGVQYLGALVAVGLVVVAVMRARMSYKSFKRRKDAAEAKSEEEPKEESPRPETPKILPSYEEEEDELAYLDELDAEEDARYAAQQDTSEEDARQPEAEQPASEGDS